MPKKTREYINEQSAKIVGTLILLTIVCAIEDAY